MTTENEPVEYNLFHNRTKVPSQLRNFVFTINNYDDTSLTALKNVSFRNGKSKLRYLVVGQEVGKKCGTPHLQGYCELAGQVTFSALKNLIPTAHIQNRYGTPLQASTYCKKDGKYEEIGTMSAQGKRTDLDEAKDIVSTTMSIREVMDNVGINPQVVSACETYIKYNDKPDVKLETITEIFDPEEIELTMRNTDPEDVYYKDMDDDNKFSGYDGQGTLIITNMSYTGQSWYNNLILGIPVRVNTHNSSRFLKVKHLILFSQDINNIKLKENQKKIKQTKITQLKNATKICQETNSSPQTTKTSSSCETFNGS